MWEQIFQKIHPINKMKNNCNHEWVRESSGQYKYCKNCNITIFHDYETIDTEKHEEWVSEQD
jgi:hypothetical protein